MKPILLAISISLVGLTACEHSTPEPADAPATPTYTEIEQFAVQSVYEAHPTRALVDKIEFIPSESEHTVVIVEMTGAPEFRKIYQLQISESEPGVFRLENMETLQ
ncbi:MAG: hypothetical protein AAFW60_13575 [Pseudomonadota bacterium]